MPDIGWAQPCDKRGGAGIEAVDAEVDKAEGRLVHCELRTHPRAVAFW